MVYSKLAVNAKSHLYDDLHVMLVTVCGYEQNRSRGLGGVVHTPFQVERTYRRMYREVRILMPTHCFQTKRFKSKLSLNTILTP